MGARGGRVSVKNARNLNSDYTVKNDRVQDSLGHGRGIPKMELNTTSGVGSL